MVNYVELLGEVMTDVGPSSSTAVENVSARGTSLRPQPFPIESGAVEDLSPFGRLVRRTSRMTASVIEDMVAALTETDDKKARVIGKALGEFIELLSFFKEVQRSLSR